MMSHNWQLVVWKQEKMRMQEELGVSSNDLVQGV